MFDRHNQNFPRSRYGFPDLTVLGEFIGRWLPFAGRRSVAGTALQHLGTLPLTTQSCLALVRVYKETLVLGVTPQSVTLLTKTDSDRSPSAPESTEAAPAGSEGLRSLLTVSRRGKE